MLPHEPKNGEIVRKRGIRRLAGVEATDEMPEEDDMSAMQELLASMSKEGSPSGSGIKMKPVKDKNSRREGHRRRRDWRREESMGYRA